MTVEETTMILTLLQVEYPQSFSRMDARMMQAKIELWASEFSGDDYKAVEAAVRAIISAGNREFAPNISAIREKLYEHSASVELDEGTAWAMVAKACANGIYGYQKEFDKLPPEIQSAVGSANQIREWAMVDEAEFHTVIGSNFRRAFRVTKARARERAMLPENVKALLKGMDEKRKLTE